MVRVLVCVTRQVSCKRLIETGARFASESGGTLSVVHVAPGDALILDNASEGSALDFLMNIARRYDAEMTVLRAGDVRDALVRHARDKRITHIILGVSSAKETGATSFAQTLRADLPDVQLFPVPA